VVLVFLAFFVAIFVAFFLALLATLTSQPAHFSDLNVGAAKLFPAGGGMRTSIDDRKSRGDCAHDCASKGGLGDQRSASHARVRNRMEHDEKVVSARMRSQAPGGASAKKR